MNNDLKQFSEERLKAWISDDPNKIYHVEGEDLQYLARIALSVKQAKPIGAMCEDGSAICFYDDRDVTVQKVMHWVACWPISIYTPQPAHTEQGKAVANEFIPENLDRALTIMGVALPESKEEFNFQAERWMQRLINRVIRYESEFQVQESHEEQHSCKWKPNEDSVYSTGCGNEWQFTEGGLEDNKIKFCPYCGGEIDAPNPEIE